MGNRFYQIEDDVNVAGRWWLKSPRDSSGNPIDPESFRIARRMEVSSPLTISVRRQGAPLGFTLADFGMPIVVKQVGELLSGICQNEIQLFPATIDGYAGDYYILNALNSFPCLDEEKSSVLFWGKDDGRPDKIGQYKQVIDKRIRTSLVKNENIFRISNWEVALIVSERIKHEFEKSEIAGAQFTEV